mmetsp:Transcript_12985/g.23325  ORF Transcript_12985/g.23325 Transcript_12985/m.23325 type:complete len:231 (+) Transcript_12985:124-816(+)
MNLLDTGDVGSRSKGNVGLFQHLFRDIFRQILSVRFNCLRLFVTAKHYHLSGGLSFFQSGRTENHGSTLHRLGKGFLLSVVIVQHVTQLKFNHLSNAHSNLDVRLTSSDTGNDHGLDVLKGRLRQNLGQRLGGRGTNIRLASVVSVSNRHHDDIGTGDLQGMLQILFRTCVSLDNLSAQRLDVGIQFGRITTKGGNVHTFTSVGQGLDDLVSGTTRSTNDKDGFRELHDG